MAIVRKGDSASLTIRIEVDTDTDGSAIYANRTVGRIRYDATDEQVFDFAAAIGTLQSYPVGAILRTDKAALTRS